ncbi:MAG: ATP-binding protein [Candidatus Omnitrophica bacterium]|nr:ATP-binding protein [Candidatus Omnitrophota bacterium]
MKYRHRIIESKLKKLKEHFSVIVVTGARQVGKSTLLVYLFGKNARHIVFDPVTDDLGARRDPEFFLQQNKTPLILDEIQYSPELLPIIKKKIDQDRTPGQFFLTGSQNLSVIKSISESMAGRAAVVDMDPMSVPERLGRSGPALCFWLEEILRAGKGTVSLDQLRRSGAVQARAGLFKMLWRGGYPGTLDLPDDLLADYFQSYIRTYVERDIRVIAEVSDQQTFSRFFGLAAALTAQEVNYSHLGRELGITPQTASRWLNILKATYQWFELPSYHGNSVKRLSNKGKGYLTDTGLACYLTRVSSPEALATQPLLGAIFETHVVLEIKRMFSAVVSPVNFFHWRAHSGAEVDLVIERDGILLPVEIKCKAKITSADIRGLVAFREAYPKQCGIGALIASVEEPYFYSKDVLVLPYSLCGNAEKGTIRV